MRGGPGEDAGLTYGRYQLIDLSTGAAVSVGTGDNWLTLSQAERHLGMLISEQDPQTTRVIKGVAKLAMNLSPMAGLDPRTLARLAAPVGQAANLLGEGTIEDLEQAVRGILAAPPAAPPDQGSIGELVNDLRIAFDDYQQAKPASR